MPHKDPQVSFLHSFLVLFIWYVAASIMVKVSLKGLQYFYGNNTAAMAINAQETVTPKAQDSLLVSIGSTY
jgi:hypothetical protein